MEPEEKTQFVHGQWATEICEQSSNFREFVNTVKSIKKYVDNGTLKGAELFMFTDNSTVEAAFWKGNSKSEKLFRAVLELKKMEMVGDVMIHIIHVAGTRMIRSGVDGLSRADKTAGVMKGESMLQHVPLHQFPNEREPELEGWFRAWWPEKQCGPLRVHTRPEDWFTTCHESGCHLWFVPPAAGDAVAEELGRAIHKRSQNTHIIVIPRLMENRWGRKLRRESTFLFVIPVGTEGVWGVNMYEPLFMFVSLPLCRYKPWTLKGTRFVDEFCGTLRAVWEGPDARRRHLLRKLFVTERRLCSLSEGMVREVLRAPRWKPLPREVAEG